MSDPNESLPNKSLPKKNRWGLGVLAVIYTIIFGLILLFAYLGKLPLFLTQNDKPAHIILYAIAAWIGHQVLNYRQTKFATFSLPLFPVLFTLFTIAEELVQSLSPNRSLDIWDLVASLVGIAIGYGLAERQKPAN